MMLMELSFIPQVYYISQAHPKLLEWLHTFSLISQAHPKLLEWLQTFSLMT
jgi:hypothetical protein